MRYLLIFIFLTKNYVNMEKFYFFNSFLDTAKAIEDKELRLEYLMAVAEYGIEGKESDNPLIKALMVQTKFVLDRSKELSDKKSESMKGNSNAVKTFEKHTKQTKTEKNREKQKKQEEEVEVEEEYKEIWDNKLSHKESECVSEFDIALNNLIEARKKLKKPMTENAIKLVKNKLEKMYPWDTEMQIISINQSIERGWQSVFEVKEQDLKYYRNQPKKKKTIELHFT